MTATAPKLSGLVYIDPGADAYNGQDRTRVRRLRQRVEHLGCGLVTLSAGEVIEASFSGVGPQRTDERSQGPQANDAKGHG